MPDRRQLVEDNLICGQIWGGGVSWKIYLPWNTTLQFFLNWIGLNPALCSDPNDLHDIRAVGLSKCMSFVF